MPEGINKKYEAKHLAKIKAEQEKIKRVYLKAIDKIYKKASGLQLKGDTFRISDYPGLSNEIDKQLLSFSKEVNVTIQNGIKDEWELSINKNVEIIHKRYGEKNVSEAVNKIIYDPQEKALEIFQQRRIKGLGLSDRVWQYTDQFKSEIERNLFNGLSEGKSAVAMARDQKKFLEMTDMVFKRKMDDSVKPVMQKRKLVLSDDAKRYKPGRGVYRSSYKNAMRLTRTVINESYRESDMIRYQSVPFILGYKVSLSNNHPVRDVCDDLQGLYPKTFKWRAWHVQCMCSCAPELPSPADYAKYEQAILNGTEEGYKFKGEVKELPNNLNSYIEKNKGKMDGWAKKPDWVIENGVKM